MKNDKVLIINPPLWYYQSVPSDLIYAAYKFKEYGIKPVIRDLNMELFQYIFQNSNVLDTLQKEEFFYDIEKLENTYQKMKNIFQDINHRIAPNELALNYYHFAKDVRILSNIMDFCEDQEKNIYFNFFQTVIDGLVEEKIEFIAMAIYHPDQLVPLFTLCNMLRKRNPNIYIHLYGNLEDQINTKILFEEADEETCKKFYSYFDSIGMDNSYEEMVNLYQTVMEKKEDRKNTLTIINQTKEVPVFELDSEIVHNIPSSGFMPAEVINIISSSGCYWGRCSYCSIQEHSKYKKSRLDSIIEMFHAAMTDKRFQVIRFRDCCLSPRDLDNIAQRLLDEHIQIPWCCRVRFEKEFDSKLFKKLKSAGCIMLSFGIESFQEDVLKSMNKGIDVVQAMDTVHACYKAGIAVKLTAIINYPQETAEQSLYNIQKMKEVAPYCVDIKCNSFVLFNNTKIAANPNAYNVQVKEDTKHYEFSYFYDYVELASNKDVKYQEKAAMEIKELENSIRPFISEEHLLLYLKKYGLQHCMEIIHSRK